MSIILERPDVVETSRKLRATLVARAADLVPLLRTNATTTEDERRVPEENIAAIERAGLFRLTQPKRFGGFEADFRTKLEVISELARGCGSTAWVTSLMTGGAWFIGVWNDDAQADVWGRDPNARIAGVTAPTGTAEAVGGGYRVSGRWAYCSGSLHADWLYLGVPIMDQDGQPADVAVVLVPAAEVAIEDTWHMAGMRGTGSNTVVANDVFVPDHRLGSLGKLISGEYDHRRVDETLYQVPFVSAVTIDLLGPQLGLARAALELVIEQAGTKGIPYTEYDLLSNAPTVQLAVAKAATLIDTAELLAYRAAAEVDEAGQLNKFPDHLARARNKMDITQAIVNAREAIRELVSARGSSSFAEANPLQRIWRDSEVASRHAVAHPGISAQLYGRALLGITDGVTTLV
ncbi:acyl-CoA dehydrogenase family protein [Mycobacterium sp.]|jgi:3-hydroxy-9,10-secoandrosta-1,3,5(10)-triene-9,17-dione monooxygenase|uniref:acyl-CoA dehydrogenase family protein n=1 Tax=Mycobacterium sp. TaxID=1785 RepID=UPI0028B2EFFF|nr:oxidoreductase [Mycobacterium sp.]MDT5054137.1 3-hydroxy-9,10-secoandrosta,3,5(10)-triene-9,17-dione monooxygenase [Mycobacterium sp.]